MRIAIKYSMDDVQDAVIKVIHRRDSDIPQLVFVVEFPGYFSKGFAINVFTEANSQIFPTAEELEPIMAYPALIALLIQYRDVLVSSRGALGGSVGVTRWLEKQFKSFGFKPTD